MGVSFNRLGFVLLDTNSTMIQDSAVSALSHKSVVPSGVLEKVPGTDGLFYRLRHAEVEKLTKADRTAIHKAARRWMKEMQADLPETSEDDYNEIGEQMPPETEDEGE